MFNSIDELKTYLFESGYPTEAVWVAVDVFQTTGSGESAVEAALRIVNELFDGQYEEMGEF
jgi:hypothetical protein